MIRSMREQLIKALIAHAHGDIQKHAANVEVYLANASSNVYTPVSNVSTVNAGNITYSNTEFNPTGEDALTPDIGAMDYFGNFWEAGITWNNTTSSDSDYVTNNRLNFTYTSSGNPSSYS